MLVVPFFRIRIGVFNLGPGVLRWQEEISNEGTLFNYFATILEKSSAKIIRNKVSQEPISLHLFSVMGRNRFSIIEFC